MICVLKVIDGPAQGTQLWISRNQCLMIGRMSTADFSIPTDPHLSRNHMFIEGGEADFNLRDAGSSNGTYVNNSPISTIQLSHGDLIRAGKSVFEVNLKQETDQPRVAAENQRSAQFIAPQRTLARHNNRELPDH